jgi:ATP-dependent DNA helicase RecG
MRLIENWGTGIRRMIEDCRQSGLPDPRFSEIGDSFRVELFRIRSNIKYVEETPSRYRAGTEQVPSRYRAGTEQLNDKRLMELVDFCSVPRKRSEMQSFLGLSHREHFREKVLRPLLEKGLIIPTVPDKPTSSKQMYVKVDFDKFSK